MSDNDTQKETELENTSAFDLTEMEKDEIMVNPKHSKSDPIRDELRKKTFKKAIIIMVGILMIVAVAFGVIKFSEKITDKPAPTPTESVSETEDTNIVETEQQNKPEMTAMQREYPNAPEVKSGQVKTSVENNTITTTTGYTLTFPENFKIKNTTPCDIKMNTDFCLVGNGTLGDAAEPNTDFYFFKDLVHVSLFENPSKFEKVDIEGSPIAANTVLKIGDKEIPALTIALDDSSGWLITQSDESNQVNVELTNGVKLGKQ